jgi:hypothetical protein
MKALILFTAAMLLAGCHSDAPKANSPTSNVASSGVVVGNYELGTPIMVDNVTVVPILSRDAQKQTGNEITLTEAKKAGLVEIIEIPGGEQVNKLSVHNKSDRPLLLIGGELLLGGKQDRIVVRDVIVPAGATQDVEVDCVEHGRWEGKSEHFQYSTQIVPSDVRAAAAYEDQNKVWENVDGYNKASGTNASGITLQSGLNSPNVDKRVQENLPGVSQALSQDERTVGAIYVLNGDIKSMDLFGNHKLFGASQESLLRGYLAEGAVSPDHRKTPAMSDLKAFLSDAINGKREKGKSQGAYQLTVEHMNGNEVRTGDEAAGGVIIHGSYSKH